MLSLRVEGATRILAEAQDEYHVLAIRDEERDGLNYMTSLWEPTPKELDLLNRGGAIRLTILGTAHPPVLLAVQEPPAE